jgi:hypothetical protein
VPVTVYHLPKEDSLPQEDISPFNDQEHVVVKDNKEEFYNAISEHLNYKIKKGYLYGKQSSKKGEKVLPFSVR